MFSGSFWSSFAVFVALVINVTMLGMNWNKVTDRPLNRLTNLPGITGTLTTANKVLTCAPSIGCHTTVVDAEPRDNATPAAPKVPALYQNQIVGKIAYITAFRVISITGRVLFLSSAARVATSCSVIVMFGCPTSGYISFECYR